MISRGNGASLLLGFSMLLTVVLFDPADLSVWIERAIGWKAAAQPEMRAPLRDTAAGAPVAVDSLRLRQHLEALTAYPSRVTGYPGAERAARYLEEEFLKLGLESVSSDTFALPIPVDRGGEIRLLASGERYRLFSLWPNHVRTPTLPAAGIEGHLIDVGTARLSELDGNRVDGSIALVDFACGANYLTASALGARAILFFGGESSITRTQAADKFLPVPADIPRFWLQPEAPPPPVPCGRPLPPATRAPIFLPEWIGSRSRRVISTATSAVRTMTFR